MGYFTLGFTWEKLNCEDALCASMVVASSSEDLRCCFCFSWASILLTQILGERYSDFRLIRGAPFGAFCVAGVGGFDHASILLTQILGARYSDFG